MNAKEVLEELEKLGTEQNRKVYRRHGVGDNLFGVSYADLGKLAKRLKQNQQLARELWLSGNHDARVLAAMIGDPAQVTDKELEVWAKDLGNPPLTDAFSTLVSKTASASKKMAKWQKSNHEWIGRTGWLLLAHLANTDKGLPDAFFSPYLEEIERTIHSRKNHIRDAMNSALIAIGIRSPALEKQALACAARIGKVVVDHGETNCKTPDAATYIRKTVERRKR